MGTDAKEADRQLRRIAGARRTIEIEEARWLLIGRRARVHELHGFVTFIEYLERVLDYSPRVAHERLRIAEALEELPMVRASLAAGEVTYSAVREMTRVTRPKTEEAWVAAARYRTAREVQAMVRGRRPGDRPDDPRDPDLEPRPVRFEVLPETYALFQEAQREARRQAGHAVSDDEVIAWVIDVGPAVVAQAQCDATLIGRVDDGLPTRATQTLTDARRLRIFRRDHGRCTVPGCRSTDFIHIHHIVEREHGGGHEATNLTLLCGGHHRALHDGEMRLTGEAPDRLTFTHRDGRPWGAPPPTDHVDDARSALRNLGFSAAETARALAAAHAGTAPTLEDLVRAALRELRPGGR